MYRELNAQHHTPCLDFTSPTRYVVVIANRFLEHHSRVRKTLTKQTCIHISG